MKMLWSPFFLASAIILAIAWISPIHAEQPESLMRGRVEQALRNVDPILLPAKAPRIVTESPKAEQQQAAVAVTLYVMENMPSSALVVLRAVVEAAPETGPEVAAAAAKLKPQWLRTIARTLAAAAPCQADRLIYRLCKVYPLEFDQITIAVCQGAPQVTPKYLSAVAEAVPGLKSSLDRQMKRQNRAADTPAIVISVVSMTLAEVNSAANLITSTLNNMGGAPSVSFADVATAILQNQIQIAGSQIQIDGNVLARLAHTARSAAAPVTSGTITITPGPIRGVAFLPPNPPTPPASAPVDGFDPNRYSSP